MCSIILSIANEVEAEWGQGNAKLIPSPIECFPGGDRFQTRGYPIATIRSSVMNPRDRKRQDTLPFSIRGTVIGVTVHIPVIKV